MSNRLAVLINGRRMGTVSQDIHGNLGFDYVDDWFDDRDAWPLSQSLPLSSQKHSGTAVWNFLEGLLPDNTEVLERWAKRFQVSARNPFGLLRHVGTDVAGAAQFIDEDDLQSVVRETGYEQVTAHEISEQLRTLRRDPEAWTFRLHNGNFSLAGAQAKFALARRDHDGWAVPVGASPSTHIFKPGIAGLRRSDLNEHLCLEVARDLNMQATRSAMMQFEDQTAYVATRFDRRNAGDGEVERLHQEDMCQALDVRPQNKYQSEGGPSPAQIIRLLRRIMTAVESARAVDRFVDALAYNWLIGASDGHAKNFSLTYVSGRPQFSPLYDINSAAPYPEEISDRELRMAMKIGSEYHWRNIEGRHWAALAEEIGLRPEAVLARVERIGAELPAAVARVCARPALREIDADFVDLWASSVTDLAGRAMGRLARR